MFAAVLQIQEARCKQRSKNTVLINSVTVYLAGSRCGLTAPGTPAKTLLMLKLLSVVPSPTALPVAASAAGAEFRFGVSAVGAVCRGWHARSHLCKLSKVV